MTLVEAQNEITKISDNKEINERNYIESLPYISNLYLFLNAIKDTIYKKENIVFLPTFKGKYIVEELGIPSISEENEMRYFKLKSNLFLVDKEFVEKLRENTNSICSEIIAIDDMIIFKLI